MEAGPAIGKKFRDQISRCSRCGFCQVSCPVYRATLRPAVNPRGKMLILKEVIEGRLAFGQELQEVFYQCTLCANCALNCPAGVDVAEVLLEARKEMVRTGDGHPVFEGLQQVLDGQANIYGEERGDPFGREKSKTAEYIFFVGCVGSFREIESTRQILTLLDRLKVDYTLIDEVCCSGILEEVGYPISADRVRENCQRIVKTGAKTVITGCPYCFRAFNRTPPYAPLRDRGIEIVHLTQFLEGVDFGVTTKKRITYHDPCDLGRHSKIYGEPRRIIQRIAPNFVEMTHHQGQALCCGAGGGMRAAYPGMSIKMAGHCLREATDSGADILLTNCNSCLHNLSNAQKRYSSFRKDQLGIYNLGHYLNFLLDEAE
jgi:heterodisulfide reductase subunit D